MRSFRPGWNLAIEGPPERCAELERLLSEVLPSDEPTECAVLLHEPPEFDALERLGRGPVGVPVLVVTREPDAAWRRAALRAGAHEVRDASGLDPGTLAEALQDARARFSAPSRPRRFVPELLDNLFAFVGVLETDGTLLEANRAPLAAAGIRLEDVQGRKFWDCDWWNYSEAASRQVREACERAAAGEVVRYDAVVRMAGDARTIDFQVAPLRDEWGTVTNLVPSAVDVTDRRQVERELRRNEGRFRRMFETNLLGIIVWDLHGRILDANDEFLRIVGHDRADLLAGAVDWARMTPPEHRAADERVVEELRRTGCHAPIEKEYVRKDGSRAWVLLGAAMTEGEQGIGFVLDISRQKATESALRESEAVAREAAASAEAERALLDVILEAAPVGIILADAQGRLVRLNRANELLWGPAPLSQEVEEYGDWKGWWAEGSDRAGRRVRSHEWAMARALRGETVRNDLVEIEPFGSPGVRRTMLNSGAPVRDAEGRVTGAIVAQMDISALVAAQAALRDSELRFRALADNIPQLAWMTDSTGAIFWYNRRWLEYTGTTLEEMQGWGWQSVHHPDHLPRVLARFREKVASGEPWEDTFPLRSREGEFRWFLSRAIPLRDDAGQVSGWFGTNTDITEQRQAEETLREADRRKDEFIATLAHELRNPLGPVRHAVQVLRALGQPEPRQQKATAIIERQVAHMARLIDDLLDVSRIARGRLELHREPCNLAAVVRETAEDYRSTLESAGLQLRVDVPTEPVTMEGDPVRLAQMVGNLLHNAARFSGSAGKVEVRAERQGDCALIHVADDGCGIEPGLLPRLFDPFSQADQGLARSRGGLGLGLALTRGLARLHGGEAEAASEGPGRGSRFTLRFPLLPGPSAEPDSRGADLPVTSLRILVVEDHRDAAETLEMLLVLRGHHVRVAFDGQGALAVAHEFRPHVVLSDLGLPGALDGYSLARALRQDGALSGVRLVALSGYADDAARRRSREAGFDLHLGKPIGLPELEEALAGLD